MEKSLAWEISVFYQENIWFDLDDLKRKIETFENGDIRKIILRAKSDYKTFFVTDEKKANDSLGIKMDSEMLQLPPMNLNFGFIKEEARKTKLG